MKPIRQLPERWRDRAKGLEPFAEGAARAFEMAADDLEGALDAADDELLSPSDAAEYSGVTERTLRTWRADGRIANHGTDTRPMYRRGDLPRRGGATPDAGTYDAAADAVRLAS